MCVVCVCECYLLVYCYFSVNEKIKNPPHSPSAWRGGEGEVEEMRYDPGGTPGMKKNHMSKKKNFHSKIINN